jgi:4-hydroxy-tetrahydrodipicolinate synthase
LLNNVGIFGGLGGVYFLEEMVRGASGMTGFAFPEILVNIYNQFQNNDLDKARSINRYWACDP